MKTNLQINNDLDQWILNVTGFSIIGLLLASKITTLIPSIIIVMCLCALAVNRSFRKKWKNIFAKENYHLIAWPFITWFLSNLFISIIHHDQNHISFPSNAFTIAAATTLLCLHASNSLNRYLIMGIASGAVLSIFWGAHDFLLTNLRAQGPTNNPIYFGNITALIMMFCISIAFFSKNASFIFRSLFILLALGAALATLTSQTRSSGFIIFCLLPIFFLKQKDLFQSHFTKIVATIFSLTVVFAVFSTGLQKQMRINEFYASENSELNRLDKASGNRYQLWLSAWLIFKDNTLTGAGPEGFSKNLKKFVEDGIVDTTTIYNQPHNDILHSASSGGIIKIMAYFLLIFGPLSYFYKKYKNTKINNKNVLWPVLGLQLVLSYLLFGLTNSIFDIQIYSTTYAVLVILMAKLTNLNN